MAYKLGSRMFGNNKGYLSKDPVKIRNKQLEEENEKLKKENAELQALLNSLKQEAEEFKKQKRYHEENFNSLQRDKEESLIKLADVERERDIVKSVWRRYQQQEMQEISQRRKEQLDHYRRDYEQKYGSSPQTTRVPAAGEGMDEIDGQPRGRSNPHRVEGLDEIDEEPRGRSNPHREEDLDEIDGPLSQSNPHSIYNDDQLDSRVGMSHRIDDYDQIDSGFDVTPSVPDPSVNMHNRLAPVHNDNDDDGIDVIDSYSKDE